MGDNKTIVSLPPRMLKDWRAARIANMDISNKLHDDRKARIIPTNPEPIDWERVAKDQATALRL